MIAFFRFQKLLIIETKQMNQLNVVIFPFYLMMIIFHVINSATYYYY
jgi:hypothetical protein